MHTQLGIVIELLAASQQQTDQQAVIRVMPTTDCERCIQGNGCGAGLFSRLLSRRPTELKLPAITGIKPGQRVWLVVDERLLIKQAWYWYGLPILAFIFGSAFPLWLPIRITTDSLQPAQDILSLSAGMLLLVLCWVVVRALQRPVLPKILLNSPCADQS